MKLVIVESPAKAKTIERFLKGGGYRVVASYGHIRDLPSSAAEIPEAYKKESWARLAVDVDNKFTPIYVVTRESRKQVAELKKLLKDADEVILATDEDREGESISWHLLETLKPKVPVKRIAFHEITQEAIHEAMANPRDVNQDLVRAQESRRILDRLYGYSLSPLLWKKVRPKLSAGRVQSVAVRLVVEREEERKAFKSSVYWDADAALSAQGIGFTATLVSLGGTRLAAGKDFDGATGELKGDVKPGSVVWLDEEKAQRIVKELRAGLPWRTARVERKAAKLKPYPPFITSTLQQAASSLLGFSPRKTMQIAQRLYEGVDQGNGDREGVITYMRTDSVVLSDKALGEAGRLIEQLFGAKYHQVRKYRTKSKMAQEAHEAIRPTHLHHTPEHLAKYLAEDELKLYRIIWNRTVASQMADAELQKTTVDFAAATTDGEALLRANGSVVTFPGFLRVADSGQSDTQLPPIEEGQVVGPGAAIALEKLAPLRHETKPPARYTEASLIQRLEEEGIGRPSTYAPTLSTIQARGYVERQGKTLIPTFLAVAVISLLRKHFDEYVDIGFTARMEDALDHIADGHQDWVAFLEAFYRGSGKYGHGLEPQIAHEMERIEYPAIPVGNDPESGAPIVVRIGRSAPYLQRGDGGEGHTAPVPNDMLFEALDVEKAVGLLRDRAKGHEGLGADPKTGEMVYALLGPYGPYVQLGAVTEANKRPKRASLPKDAVLEGVPLELALKLLSLPRELGAHPESGAAISTAVGRFGPYVKCGDEFRSLEASDDVYTITLARALELIAKPKRVRGAKKVLKDLGKAPGSEKPILLCEGKYGPFVTNGSVNASLPRGQDPNTLTLEEAITLIAAAAEKAPAKGRATTKSRPKAKAKPKAKTAAKPKAKAKPKPKAK